MTMPLEVLAGPRQPIYHVEVHGSVVTIMEDGRPVDLGRPLSVSEAVREVARINHLRWTMVATAPIWPELADPQRLPVRTLRIPAPSTSQPRSTLGGVSRGWYAN